ncbi:sodium channel, voltage-gated, type I, beta b isoform X1 [Sebastes umbrosus]|uniref:sodium channel, voltage-gated, type I, beta b isoform X1 n=1 Tax=Sebastes umbrosus TaxID=72105 RepID=UPI00189DE046|nr:sodium channel, voltage-gated, type I, beta b isoform X1 [Sebastes umbrosus]
MALAKFVFVLLFCSTFVLCSVLANLNRGHGACAEVDSDTEAVAGKGFKLGCISCKKRSEVNGAATVEWYFRGKGEADFNHIYTYNEGSATIEHDDFIDRVDWNGSKRSHDIQDASIYLLNVTFNDSGTYQCFLNRILFYTSYEYTTLITKVVHLTVVAKATRGTASIVSEVMMYVAIIGLQVWLLIEMIYCYRKISAAGEEALREAANAEYLAIASESKDNCAGVQVGE